MRSTMLPGHLAHLRLEGRRYRLPSPVDRWAHRRVSELLGSAGITIDGTRPWDIRVVDQRFFRRLAFGGLDALGDAYVAGWWESEALDQFFDRILRTDLPRRAWLNPWFFTEYLRQRLLNLQTRAGARRNGQAHYDRGNDLFAAMLDRRMVYTCGYWNNAATLDEAQEAKLDLVCRKIGLRPGERVLDIGCGWGSFAKYAAEKYGAHVVGVTISSRQVELGRQICRGLPVEIRLQDYRDVNETFDHIISLGMFEHVGPKNYCTYMQMVHRCLRDEGLFLLHTFAARTSFPNTRDSEVVWVNRHIFPGLVVPSLKQIGVAIDGLFVIEDLHNFGPHYDPTLRAWFANLDRNWPQLAGRYGPRFYRMWKYYLLACAGAFRCRKYQLWQMVLSKNGVPGGHVAVR